MFEYNCCSHKVNLWINCANPSTTFVLYHPRMFDVPIAYKPVYLNMNMDFENIQIFDFMANSTWNIHAHEMLFGIGWDSLDHSWENHPRGR